MTRLTSGPAEVLTSGVATTWFGHGLELRFVVADRPLRVAFTFAREGGAPRVETTTLDDGWALRLVDLDDVGRGSADPVLLGAIGPDLVFLHFRVLGTGDSADRTLHYTLHRVAKADVAWRPHEDP